ncbi:hypothetical protein [Paraburkholderia unamae]|uniref:Uncharacterized protein n=1 Tax=Paraburkholderia unamae TaxID=219649 RepID=A0ACC6RPS0_9BURK
MITATFNARLVDRMQKLAYSLPIQCPWWKFSAIGTRCVDNIKAILRVALIGAEPQKGAQVRNRMLKGLAAKMLAGLVDKGQSAQGGASNRRSTGRR